MPHPRLLERIARAPLDLIRRLARPRDTPRRYGTLEIRGGGICRRGFWLSGL